MSSEAPVTKRLRTEGGQDISPSDPISGGVGGVGNEIKSASLPTQPAAANTAQAAAPNRPTVAEFLDTVCPLKLRPYQRRMVLQLTQHLGSLGNTDASGADLLSIPENAIINLRSGTGKTTIVAAAAFVELLFELYVAYKTNTIPVSQDPDTASGNVLLLGTTNAQCNVTAMKLREMFVLCSSPSNVAKQSDGTNSLKGFCELIGADLETWYGAQFLGSAVTGPSVPLQPYPYLAMEQNGSDGFSSQRRISIRRVMVWTQEYFRTLNAKWAYYLPVSVDRNGKLTGGPQYYTDDEMRSLIPNTRAPGELRALYNVIVGNIIGGVLAANAGTTPAPVNVRDAAMGFIDRVMPYARQCASIYIMDGRSCTGNHPMLRCAEAILSERKAWIQKIADGGGKQLGLMRLIQGQHTVSAEASDVPLSIELTGNLLSLRPTRLVGLYRNFGLFGPSLRKLDLAQMGEEVRSAFTTMGIPLTATSACLRASEEVLLAEGADPITAVSRMAFTQNEISDEEKDDQPTTPKVGRLPHHAIPYISPPEIIPWLEDDLITTTQAPDLSAFAASANPYKGGPIHPYTSAIFRLVRQLEAHFDVKPDAIQALVNVVAVKKTEIIATMVKARLGGLTLADYDSTIREIEALAGGGSTTAVVLPAKRLQVALKVALALLYESLRMILFSGQKLLELAVLHLHQQRRLYEVVGLGEFLLADIPLYVPSSEEGEKAVPMFYDVDAMTDAIVEKAFRHQQKKLAELSKHCHTPYSRSYSFEPCENSSAAAPSYTRASKYQGFQGPSPPPAENFIPTTDQAVAPMRVAILFDQGLGVTIIASALNERLRERALAYTGKSTDTPSNHTEGTFVQDALAFPYLRATWLNSSGTPTGFAIPGRSPAAHQKVMTEFCDAAVAPEQPSTLSPVTIPFNIMCSTAAIDDYLALGSTRPHLIIRVAAVWSPSVAQPSADGAFPADRKGQRQALEALVKRVMPERPTALNESVTDHTSLVDELLHSASAPPPEVLTCPNAARVRLMAEEIFVTELTQTEKLRLTAVDDSHNISHEDGHLILVADLAKFGDSSATNHALTSKAREDVQVFHADAQARKEAEKDREKDRLIALNAKNVVSKEMQLKMYADGQEAAKRAQTPAAAEKQAERDRQAALNVVTKEMQLKMYADGQEAARLRAQTAAAAQKRQREEEAVVQPAPQPSPYSSSSFTVTSSPPHQHQLHHVAPQPINPHAQQAYSQSHVAIPPYPSPDPQVQYAFALYLHQLQAAGYIAYLTQQPAAAPQAQPPSQPVAYSYPNQQQAASQQPILPSPQHAAPQGYSDYYPAQPAHHAQTMVTATYSNPTGWAPPAATLGQSGRPARDEAVPYVVYEEASRPADFDFTEPQVSESAITYVEEGAQFPADRKERMLQLTRAELARLRKGNGADLAATTKLANLSNVFKTMGPQHTFEGKGAERAWASMVVPDFESQTFVRITSDDGSYFAPQPRKAAKAEASKRLLNILLSLWQNL